MITWLAFAFLTAWMIFRTIATGHGPFANMYEFSVAFSWGTLGGYLYFERRYRQRVLALIALGAAPVRAQELPAGIDAAAYSLLAETFDASWSAGTVRIRLEGRGTIPAEAVVPIVGVATISGILPIGAFFIGAQRLKHIKPGHLGEHEVQQHDVWIPEQRLRERLVFGLRLIDGIAPVFLTNEAARKRLIDQGLLEETDGRIKLTEAGRRYADTVAAELI